MQAKVKEEFMFEAFSTNAIQMIDEALKIAKLLGKKWVGSEHLLLAMYQTKDSICHFLLEEKNIQYEDLLHAVEKLVILRKTDHQDITYTKKFQEIILFSENLATDLNSDYVYDEHIFYVMLKEYDSVACIVLEKLGLVLDELAESIEEIFGFFEQKGLTKEIAPYPFLIHLSSTTKIHPFVSRSNYVEKIQFILSKKQKNNPLLIGNAGVGKTAIVEGLSEILQTDIYQLDLGGIVSGTKYRGELEEKLTKAMEYIKKKKAILFIDEIHNIVGAGSNDGSLDIANILKPYLSRSDMKLIGATTLDEYYHYIDKDKALSRRFQNVFIDEPTEEETYHILKEIKTSYENYHHVKYTNKDLQTIIQKSKSYLVNRNFPDKAIDVMDEVGARKKSSDKNIRSLIDDTIEDMTSIHHLTLTELKKAKLNYPELKKNYVVFIEKGKWKLHKPNIAVVEVEHDFVPQDLIIDLMKLFHFKKEMYLEVDLETYQDPIMINNLIGSVKGYVGYEQGGLLSEHLIRYPMAFVYLRHFDQAHISIQQFLYQLFQKETFLDNKGRTIYLTNAIFAIGGKQNSHHQTGFIHSNESQQKNRFLCLKTLPTIYNQNQYNEMIKKQPVQIVNFQDIPEHKKEDVFYNSLLLEKGKYYYNPQTDQLETRNKTR